MHTAELYRHKTINSSWRLSSSKRKLGLYLEKKNLSLASMFLFSSEQVSDAYTCKSEITLILIRRSLCWQTLFPRSVYVIDKFTYQNLTSIYTSGVYKSLVKMWYLQNRAFHCNLGVKLLAGRIQYSLIGFNGAIFISTQTLKIVYMLSYFSPLFILILIWSSCDLKVV